MKTAFVLFIAMLGSDDETAFQAGRFKSEASCEAMGAKIVRDINESDEIRARPEIKAEFECKPSTNSHKTTRT